MLNARRNYFPFFFSNKQKEPVCTIYASIASISRAHISILYTQFTFPVIVSITMEYMLDARCDMRVYKYCLKRERGRYVWLSKCGGSSNNTPKHNVMWQHHSERWNAHNIHVKSIYYVQLYKIVDCFLFQTLKKNDEKKSLFCNISKKCIENQEEKKSWEYYLHSCVQWQTVAFYATCVNYFVRFHFLLIFLNLLLLRDKQSVRSLR